MRKSKIIIPIIGMMMLSTAATVSGTVAWFTAQRTYNNTISSFGIREIDGNMTFVSASNIVGTTVENNAATSTVEVSLAVGGHASYLADASWNYHTHILYTDNGSATNTSTGFNESSFISLGTADGTSGNEASKWKVSASEDNYLYYACAYQIVLAYDFTQSDHPVNLMLDLTDSGCSFTHATGEAGTSATEIYSGLRIGFLSEGYQYDEGSIHSSNRVIAPFQGTAANVKCVRDTSSVETVVAAGLINSSTGTFNSPKHSDYTSVSEFGAEYLGTFHEDIHPDNLIHSDQLALNIVIWLEGTDPNVISANTKSTFSASLKFYCIQGLESDFY